MIAETYMNFVVIIVAGCIAYALIQGAIWIAAAVSWPVLIAVCVVLVFVIALNG